MRVRWIALVPLAGLALATAAYAGHTTTPQIKDPTGDAAGGQAGMDIVSVLFTTSGTGSGKGYVPKAFSVTMTLAGPVEAGPGLTYEVDATTSTCGDLSFTYEPGTPYEKAIGPSGWAQWGSCTNTTGDGGIELLSPTVAGNKITWEFGLRSIGLKPGAVFKNFVARVDPSNPVIPYPSHGDAGMTGLGLIDAASGSGSWTLS
jgi:hypothetical protein